MQRRAISFLNSLIFPRKCPNQNPMPGPKAICRSEHNTESTEPKRQPNGIPMRETLSPQRVVQETLRGPGADFRSRRPNPTPRTTLLQTPQFMVTPLRPDLVLLKYGSNSDDGVIGHILNNQTSPSNMVNGPVTANGSKTSDSSRTVTAGCSDTVTADCSDTVTAGCSDTVTAGCSDTVTAGCSDTVTAGCSNAVTASCSKTITAGSSGTVTGSRATRGAGIAKGLKTDARSGQKMTRGIQKRKKGKTISDFKIITDARMVTRSVNAATISQEMAGPEIKGTESSITVMSIPSDDSNDCSSSVRMTNSSIEQHFRYPSLYSLMNKTTGFVLRSQCKKRCLLVRGPELQDDLLEEIQVFNIKVEKPRNWELRSILTDIQNYPLIITDKCLHARASSEDI